MNPVKALENHGQSVWLDFLARGFVAKGELKKLIDEDGVKGVTSNPSIFEKAIGSSDEYDGAIGKALHHGDQPVAQRAFGRRHGRRRYEAVERRGQQIVATREMAIQGGPGHVGGPRDRFDGHCAGPAGTQQRGGGFQQTGSRPCWTRIRCPLADCDPPPGLGTRPSVYLQDYWSQNSVRRRREAHSMADILVRPVQRTDQVSIDGSPRARVWTLTTTRSSRK